MTLVDGLRRWSGALSLFGLCLVYLSLQREMLTGVATEGLTAIDTLYELSLAVMLLITLGMTVYEVRRTMTDAD